MFFEVIPLKLRVFYRIRRPFCSRFDLLIVPENNHSFSNTPRVPNASETFHLRRARVIVTDGGGSPSEHRYYLGTSQRRRRENAVGESRGSGETRPGNLYVVYETNGIRLCEIRRRMTSECTARWPKGKRHDSDDFSFAEGNNPVVSE